MAGEGEKQLGQGAPEEKDQTPEKEPQKPEKGVPIDAGDESVDVLDDALLGIFLEALYGKQKAEEMKDTPQSKVMEEVEKSIRQNPDYEKKVQDIIDNPEDFVSREQAPKIKKWLQERLDGAKKEVEEKSNETGGDDGKEQKRGKEDLPNGFDLKAELDEVKNLSNEDLMKRLFDKLSKFLKRFSDGSLAELFGAGGPMFSKKEVENIEINIDKAEEQVEAPEKDKNEARVVKFVCDALNLPVKKDVNALWFSLKNTEGITSEDSQDLFTQDNVKEGDVLFFRKEGEPTPYLAAVVSKVGPPIMMKYVDESGSVKEEDVLNSELYSKQWFGFMKIPKKSEEKGGDEEVVIEKVEKQ